MEHEANSPAKRRFTDRFHIRVLLRLLALALPIWAIRQILPKLGTAGTAYLIASLLGFAGLGFIVTHGVYLVTAKDEFQRTVHIESILWSIGVTFTVTTFWGLLETFAHIPHLGALWICPMFVVFMGLAKRLVRLRYK